MMDENLNLDRSVSCKDPIHENVQVKISASFKSIVVGNMSENYMLYEVENLDGTISYDQKIIPNLKNKVIRSIMHAGKNDFIFICCYEYD